jgi:hypothetical protein
MLWVANNLNNLYNDTYIKWKSIMLEAYGNIWDIVDEGGWDALAITTNGYVAKNGRAVMGRGIAKEAADRFPELAGQLGTAIKNFGNIVHVFSGYAPYDLVSFPVKPVFGPHSEPGWQAKADPQLIYSSSKELVFFADRYGWKDVLLPRPGTGNGRLHWDVVKRIIQPILDDRFTVVTWHPQ